MHRIENRLSLGTHMRCVDSTRGGKRIGKCNHLFRRGRFADK